MTAAQSAPVFSDRQLAKIGKQLLSWYEKNKRDLPWRDRADEDAYATWVSEIMLQQTTVAAVLSRYEPFLERFPSVQNLAEASEEDVLAELQGMGYYRRFRAMKRAAEVVVEEMNGELPRDLKSWLALPGIGEYTAGAILSIAFNQPEPAVDGNVVRVMTRLLALPGIHEAPAAKRKIGAVVRAMIPEARASCFNQGLFDLGATVCLPVQPQCERCPVASSCQARHKDEIPLYPEKPKKKKMVDVAVAVLFCRRGDDILMLRRPPDANRMPGFREMPEVWLKETDADPSSALEQLMHERLGVTIKLGPEVGRCSHTITHHKLSCRLFAVDAFEVDSPECEWVSSQDLLGAPTSTITKKLLKKVLRED